MGNELVFRIILPLLLIAFVAHRGYYNRRFAASSVGSIKERQRDSLIVVAMVLNIAALLATLAYIINPEWTEWSSLPFPSWLRWWGVVVALLGFALLQWAHQALGKNWSDSPRMMEGQVFVTWGPYRWIRHPMYTAFFLILSAPLFLTANWLIGMAWIGMTAVEAISRIGFEEEIMLEHFGEQYRAYARRTGRLIPRLLRIR